MISDDPSDFTSGLSEESRSTISYGFKVDNICGESASCVVYRMHLGGLRVAVKRLKAEYRTNPLYMAAYQKEFMIGQQLKHDALPVYRELHDDMNEVYIIMDYVDGVQLDEFIRTEEGQEYFSSVDNSRRFLEKLLNVTAYLHRSGVIHCDLKPANIILRHSDRGVMLIDLDKAYSDTLDRTHGGTTNISDPLSADEKPTAEKDYRAIGRIIDEIAEKVQCFPRSKFKKFRIACAKEGITDERLQNLLSSSTGKIWWAIGAICLVAMVAMMFGIYFKPSETPVPTVPAVTKDTVIVQLQQPQLPAESVVVQPQPQSHPQLKINFDSRMSLFIHSVDSAMSCLKSGVMINSEINDMIFDITARYTTEYGRIVNDCKKAYPALPGMDIELAVAKASEQSRALRLLQQFTQAASDTIQHRMPVYP